MNKIKNLIDPTKLGDLTKEQLVAFNDFTEKQIEELTAQRIAVRAELLDKISNDGEIIGDKSYTKIKIYTFDIELEEARNLGATKIIPEKEVLDNPTLKKLLSKNIKIKYSIANRLMIKGIIKKT